MNNKRNSDEAGSSLSPSTPVVEEFRKLKACARCHRLKIRCKFVDHSYKSCVNCYTANLECSMTLDPTLATAKPRPRKKIKAMEKQNALSELHSHLDLGLQALNNLKNEHSDKETIEKESTHLFLAQKKLTNMINLVSHEITSRATNSSEGKTASSANSMKEGVVRAVPKLPLIPFESNIVREITKLGLISLKECSTRFSFFVNEMLEYWPCVNLSLYADDFESLLDKDPLLLLGCISVTCLNNPDLHDTLLYYLERNLTQRVTTTGDISISIIKIYTILSLWSSPPKRWGSYKHQLNLLTAMNLTLCLDLGNEKFRNNSKVLENSSEEREIIRTYVGVYCCCSSLALSLPRFKVVTWNDSFDQSVKLLLMGETNQNDKFLAYYAQFLKVGHDYFTIFSPDLSMGTLITDIEQLKSLCEEFERAISKCLASSGLLSGSCKQRFLISIIYYQVLMCCYDFIVCKVIFQTSLFLHYSEDHFYLSVLNKLIRSAEKIIDSFLNICELSTNFPTFFYYRPMHALVSLIRVRLLVVSQKLNLEIDVEREYDRISQIMKTISKKSLVAKKMSTILSIVQKWMKVSHNFTQHGSVNSMTVLLDELGTEHAVEVLKEPTIKCEESSKPRPSLSFATLAPPLSDDTGKESKATDENRILNDIFQQIDDDINSFFPSLPTDLNQWDFNNEYLEGDIESMFKNDSNSQFW
ncbi:hypothetical protein PP7435_CHR2-0234 [Komagataella phaffii CBS 7435]|uniref:Zn(2)-C6 fungal-type domain-containing protein n=2 Tax=Komagataella phaffii TaxID=460519 RepID=C4R2H0_KOMPG|nr:Hypothetical protein PAS_chr2-2_0222 [Komagataella phaffii GS115]AOA62488.1 GQ67_01112T0 [Komagataella phaffii]CAH2447752.1 hypothetical protein BQ9382_C2-1290 [Komagataella phaffii CBS 7435]AOA67063.1 GQ68_00277T0 [Komagataella phaffii GS115]CAY69694.1 Hypothetical protein PAS_chr2-2_0222 [Komagataella phaffii GS115]CCA37930.1 hypothetical protein PP7435_CHR2-0234 [Komagataella phaffii CBS 7435]